MVIPWPTMPTAGSALMACITRLNLLGAHQSSPSRNAMISPRASGIPALNAEAWPPFALRIRRTRGSNFATISGGAIRGAVIHYYDFDVASREVLIEHADDRFFDEALVIIGVDQNGDSGLHTVLSNRDALVGRYIRDYHCGSMQARNVQRTFPECS